MNKNDTTWWAKFREVKRHYIENDEYKMISEIYSRTFNLKLDYPCKCNPKRIQEMINSLNVVYDN
jgi:predicted transcriptional regulator